MENKKIFKNNQRLFNFLLQAQKIINVEFIFFDLDWLKSHLNASIGSRVNCFRRSALVVT